MNKKHIKLILSSALIAFPGVFTAENPNIVFILADDLGWTDLSGSGSDLYETPHLDQLIKEGVQFTNAYSACTVSSPTRASILTGKYPAKLHITDWIEGWKAKNPKLQIPDWTMYLPLEEITLAEILKDKGYKTAHVGKWHLGENEKYWPENQGFDVNIGGWRKGSPNNVPNQNKRGYFSPYGNPKLSDGPDGEFLTERLADEVCKFIRQNKSNPFYLNYWLYAVHTPLQAKQEKIDKYDNLITENKRHKNSTYAALVEHMDDAVGKVIQQLKDMGLYDNTIIIFTSDNGGLIGNVNRKVTDNSPLRKGKGEKYEGGVRVPLVVKYGDRYTENKKINTPVISIDFLPTLIDIANIKVAKKLLREIDGVSFKPLLTGEKNKLSRKSIYWHYPHYHNQGATPYSAVRKDDWKLVHIIETDKYELYNLAKDIGETTDLSELNPKITKQLKRDLEKWKKKMNAQMPTVLVDELKSKYSK